MVGETGKDIGKKGLCIHVVEVAGRDERQHDGNAIGPRPGAGDGPIAPFQCNPTQRPLAGIVRETNASVLEEARNPSERFRI